MLGVFSDTLLISKLQETSETLLVQESDLSDDVFLLEAGAMARAHWIQLHKLNLQTPLVQSALLYIVENYKHVRPIWQFGLKIDETSPEWKTVLYNDFYFRHHSASIQSAITMVMGSLDDRECMRKLLNEVGAHHYFYDACEAHLELFEQAMLHTLRTSLTGDSKMDAATEQSWVEFLKDVKTYIGEGIAIQRNTYLRECMTPNEMIDIRSKWEKIIDFGLPEAGEIVCERAIKSYTKLIGMAKLEMMIPFKRSSEVFTSFAEMIMQAFDVAIQSYSQGVGFCNLVTDIKEFVVKCMILDTCPALARKAILEGLFEMLQRVCGDSELKECARRKWNKLYRALEQAIIASIMEY
ncbi:GLOBIN domain-containing protein [Trichostrongylus colubriformis]|uniref:GLOBIN domain-containing protein n=1 Tax=Trichostrongylus colubriformis TaxID=6319 RepID=A0AAN8EUV6_TRICO